MAGLINRLKRLIEKSLPLEFDWIQVETSSACNAACLYCPRTIYRKVWQDRQMSLDTFSNIQPLFRYTKLIYLQGWGEPFINPDLFSMIRIAKSSGCMVGMTSNAMLLSKDILKRIVQEGVDILGLSLSGAGIRNDEIRAGTKISKVLEVVDTLKGLKSAMTADRPLVNIAYMLLKSGIDELPSLIELFRDRGINQLVINTLDFTANENLASEALSFLKEQDYQALQSKLSHIEKLANNAGVQVYSRISKAGDKQERCMENILKAFFVSADGTVSPCVYMNIPIEKGQFFSASGQRQYKKTTFGSINERPIKDIWHSEQYGRFRDAFIGRNHPDFCLNCPKLYEKQ